MLAWYFLLLALLCSANLEKEHVDVVMPFMSAELLPLIDRKSEFEAIGTKVSVADRESVEITTNKFKFYQFRKLSTSYFCTSIE